MGTTWSVGCIGPAIVWCDIVFIRAVLVHGFGRRAAVITAQNAFGTAVANAAAPVNGA